MIGDTISRAWLRLDHEGRIAEVNQAAAEMLGQNPSAILGHGADTLAVVPIEAVTGLVDACRRNLKTPEADIAVRAGGKSLAYLSVSPCPAGSGLMCELRLSHEPSQLPSAPQWGQLAAEAAASDTLEEIVHAIRRAPKAAEEWGAVLARRDGGLEPLEEWGPAPAGWSWKSISGLDSMALRRMEPCSGGAASPAPFRGRRLDRNWACAPLSSRCSVQGLVWIAHATEGQAELQARAEGMAEAIRHALGRLI